MRLRTAFFSLTFLLSILTAGCTKLQTEPTIREGIYGFVIERYGDWMPTYGYNPNRGERPVQREVYVYEKTNNADLLAIKVYGPKVDPKVMPTACVARSASSRNGFYEIPLPAGEYSVFILEDGGLVQSYSDGQGWLSPVTVEKGERRELPLVLDHAVY